MKRFRVKILDHEMRFQGGREVPVRESTNNVLFTSKKDAWEYFYNLIGEHAMGRDFWGHFGWDDKIVETINWDEAGYCNGILYKWDGFDNDIEIGWKYNEVVYHSHKELIDAFPEYFEGYDLETDKPFIRGKDDQIADLYIDIKNKDLKPKKNELTFRLKVIETNIDETLREAINSLIEIADMSDKECSNYDKDIMPF